MIRTEGLLINRKGSLVQGFGLGIAPLGAVKRGEVIFMSGRQLYAPGPGIVRAAACVVSGMAGLDSGYITKRDEFYRLRFVELHRHRFM